MLRADLLVGVAASGPLCSRIPSPRVWGNSRVGSQSGKASWRRQRCPLRRETGGSGSGQGRWRRPWEPSPTLPGRAPRRPPAYGRPGLRTRWFRTLRPPPPPCPLTVRGAGRAAGLRVRLRRPDTPSPMAAPAGGAPWASRGPGAPPRVRPTPGWPRGSPRPAPPAPPQGGGPRPLRPRAPGGPHGLDPGPGPDPGPDPGPGRRWANALGRQRPARPQGPSAPARTALAPHPLGPPAPVGPPSCPGRGKGLGMARRPSARLPTGHPGPPYSMVGPSTPALSAGRP